MSYAPSQYASQALGLVRLITWLSTWERKPNAFRIKDGQIWLGAQPSQRFSIGVAKRKIFGKYPFLAVRGEEKEWIQSIHWDRAEIRLGSRHLYLVSKRCLGDQDEIPDIPPQVIAIEFDTAEKLKILSQAKFVEARGIWLDGEGQPQVENGPTWWKIPLVLKTDDQMVLSEEEQKKGYTADDVFQNQIAQAGVWSSKKGAEVHHSAPEYDGATPDVPSDLKSILLDQTDFKALNKKVR